MFTCLTHPQFDVIKLRAAPEVTYAGYMIGRKTDLFMQVFQQLNKKGWLRDNLWMHSMLIPRTIDLLIHSGL